MKQKSLPVLRPLVGLLALAPLLLINGCDDSEPGDGSGTGGTTESTGGFSTVGVGGQGGSGGMDQQSSGGMGGDGLGGLGGGSGGCPSPLPAGDCEPGDTLSCDGYIYPFVSVYCSCNESIEPTPQWECAL
jgi:hypothetical protein